MSPWGEGPWAAAVCGAEGVPLAPAMAIEQDVDVEHYAIEQEIWRLAEINAKRVRDVTPLRCPIDILKSGQLQPAAQGKIEFSQGS